MGEKRVSFSVSEQKTNIHRKENIHDWNHASSNIIKRHSCKRSVLMKQCKTQPPSKTENVKKSLVRNFEQAVSKKTIVSKAFREKIPMYGDFKDGNLKSKYDTRYASPELYSTLCVAKRMREASGKNNQSKDLMIHSNVDDIGKADMGAVSKLDSPVVRNDVAKKLDFPPDEQLYMDLVALDLCDKGERDPVIKSKCSVKRHSKKEVVNVKEPSSQHVCTPECNVVFNCYAKSIRRPPSPIRIRSYPMYTATEALKDSIQALCYRSEQKLTEIMKVNLEGCELCKGRDINDPGIFELNPKCYKCMYPSVDLSNDCFTQLGKSCSNKSESNISTSNTFSKKYPGSNEINPLSSSSRASTSFGITSSSRSKASTLPNSSLMEAGSNYTNKDHGSSYNGIYNSRSSSEKSQRTETGNSGSTSMFKTNNCSSKISEKSQYLETTHSKYNSGIIQDSDDTNNLKIYSYKKNSKRSVGIGNEASHSSNSSGENHSDHVNHKYSMHNDNKYSGKFQESVAIYSHYDTANHHSNDIAGKFKNIQGSETNFSKYNTGKVGGTVGTGIYKINTNDTFSAKAQTEYRNYNVGTSHSRDDTGIFKSYNDGKFSVHSEGNEADYRTFKPINVGGNDATGVRKFSVQFQGTEAVGDNSSSITGDVCGINNTGLFATYSDSKFSTESQGTEIVSDNRTNEPGRVCGSDGAGLFHTYTDDKFYTKFPGAVTVTNNIYGHHKSFSHADRIDNTFGYSINRVDDTSHGYSLPDHKQCQVPTNFSDTSSTSQISEVNSNDQLSSNNSRTFISSNLSNQASRNSIKCYDMDTHIDSPECHSTFADIVSRYSEYGAPWYYGRSQAFTNLIKNRIGEWTSSQTQFCYSVGQDNRNIISGTVIRHEAEEENSENKSEGNCS